METADLRFNVALVGVYTSPRELQTNSVALLARLGFALLEVVAILAVKDIAFTALVTLGDDLVDLESTSAPEQLGKPAWSFLIGNARDQHTHGLPLMMNYSG